MTRDDHANGTDRLADVASVREDLDIIVNVQGDEPLIDPANIDAAVQPLLTSKDVAMSTLCALIGSEAELRNPNIVKFVLDEEGFALYFSRSPIPYDRDDLGFHHLRYWGHLGLYVYRRETLLQISRLAAIPLENIEKLEQLRALETAYA
jgi:3-deoxy-manno-octulosonate cytidylyltransferase (CMP-KDO synthetase)